MPHLSCTKLVSKAEFHPLRK